ncbi:MAG: AmmeMemoRadiSam system protein A [Polyangiaceae bacterium]
MALPDLFFDGCIGLAGVGTGAGGGDENRLGAARRSKGYQQENTSMIFVARRQGSPVVRGVNRRRATYDCRMSTLSEVGPKLPSLARSTLATYLPTGRTPKFLEVGLEGPSAPVFVTLHDRDGKLRGCIGTLSAQKKNVFEETAHCAVLAATRDPRFSPVEANELGELRIDVTVLHPLESVENESHLDPRRYGIVVRDAHGRQGVLLPDLPWNDDVETQVAIARQKGRIPFDAAIQLFRFLAERFEESGGS